VNHPARTQHPPPLGQCPDPVGPAGQVVQGTQQQRGVDAGVGAVQLPRLTNRGAGQRGGRLLAGCAQRLLHVQALRVDQVDLVALRG